MEICTVCGEKIENLDGALEYIYKEKKFYFCTLACLRTFQQLPDIYTQEGSETEINILEDSKI